MRNIYLIIIVLFFNQVYSQEQKLYGEWLNDQKDSDITSIEFKQDNTAVMFQVEKVSPTFAFTADYSKKPLWLDMIIVKDGVEAKLFGLIEFLETDKVKIELFYGNFKDRPTSFSVIPSVKSRVYNFTLKK
jgi:hypothetical protein